jgi:hypothetical protein
MDGDYKGAIQEAADVLAMERFDTEFYNLTEKQQYEIYTKAEEHYWERSCDAV